MFSRDQVWIMKPGYLGSGHEIIIRRVTKKGVKVRDNWFFDKIKFYSKAYIITFFEPENPKLMALIDREVLS